MKKALSLLLAAFMLFCSVFATAENAPGNAPETMDGMPGDGIPGTPPDKPDGNMPGAMAATASAS